MGLNESIIEIRVELQNTKLKKSGKNKFAGFEYYELSDFLPTINKLMMEQGLNDLYSIEDEMATLRIIKGEEFQTYRIPFTQYMTPTNKNGQPSMQDIQYLGALNTYYKRYLYLNAFGITDGEVIDAMDKPEAKVYKTISQATEKEVTTYKNEFIRQCKVYGLEMDDIPDYFSFLGIDAQDDKEKNNTIVQFLRSDTYLGEQIEAYKLYKVKHS